MIFRQNNIRKSYKQSSNTDIPYQNIREFYKTRQRKSTKHLCNAPFRNLYFAPDGNAYVCCYNQKFSLGKFPEKSIHEIWNSTTLNDIRNHITNFDLSYGCDDCKSALIKKEFSSLHIPFYDSYFSLSEYPTFLELQIDTTCNLECDMCTGELSSAIANNKEHRKSQDNIYNDRFVDQLIPYIPHLKHILFTGGEPFLIPLYYKLWKIINEINPNCYITIQTNGSILNDRVKEAIKNGKFNIGISLDSLNDEEYSKIRVNASLVKTLENISYFSDYCKANNRFIGISTCPMQQNWREIPDILNFCNKNELKLFFNTVWFPGKSALWILESKELNDIISLYIKQHFASHSKTEKKNIETFHTLISTLKKWESVAKKWENYSPAKANEEEISVITRNILSRIKDAETNLLTSDNIIKPSKKLENVFNSIPDNNLKQKSIEIINSYDTNKIISNILREDENGLFRLVKNLYRINDL